MKNRDNFIVLMEEIDVKHLDEHIQKNTDTKRKRIRSYILSAGIYAAACVAVLLLIPVIMNFTAGPTEPPADPPGKAPMTTEPAQTDPITDKNDKSNETPTGTQNPGDSNSSDEIIKTEADIMFKVLDMTVEEIEAKYGKLVYYSPSVSVGLDIYEISGYGVLVGFARNIKYGVLQKDDVPFRVCTMNQSVNVYDGLYVGMTSTEYAKKFADTFVCYANTDLVGIRGCSILDVDGYAIDVFWELPDSIINETLEAYLYGSYDERGEISEKLQEYLKSEEMVIKCGLIMITKK